MVHHPTVIAAVAEGRRWRFEGDADVKSKFWGRSIELRPEGEVAGCTACEEFWQVPGLLQPGAPMRYRSWLVAFERSPAAPVMSPLAPLAGLLRVTFSDGDVYQWNKVGGGGRNQAKPASALLLCVSQQWRSA